MMARHLGEMLDDGISVFRAALFEPNLAVPPLLVAVVVAVVGLASRILLKRRAPRQARS